MTRIVLMACFIVGVACRAVVGAPEIFCEKPVYEFGERHEGDTFEVQFVVENRGDADLALGTIKHTCGCTTAVPQKTVLAPGETTTLKVLANTKGKKPGPHIFRIRISTNDPQRPVYELQLRGNVVVPFTAPSILAFGDILQGEGKTLTFRVTRREGVRAKVLRVVSSCPYITAEVVGEPTPESNGYGVRVSVLADAPAGWIDERLTIETDFPRQKTLTVRLGGRVVPEFVVSAVRVFFGPVSRATEPSRQVLLTLSEASEESFEVLDASVRSEHVTVTVGELAKGRQYRVTVTLKADAPLGTFNDMLSIRTSKRGFETLELPIYGLIRE